LVSPPLVKSQISNHKQIPKAKCPNDPNDFHLVLNFEIGIYLLFGLPARSPAHQSFVRRAGAPAKAGVCDLELISSEPVKKGDTLGVETQRVSLHHY